MTSKLSHENSADVTALFMSVIIDKARHIIQFRLENVEDLSDRTRLSAKQVVKLLKVYLRCTYFGIQWHFFYQQVHAAATGSPVSPIVCNLFMEHLE